jgi:hypothetical protein
MSTFEGRAALMALVLGGCTTTTTTTTTTAVYPYDEAYLTGATYTADLIYAGDYWADDWTTSTLYTSFVGAIPLPIEPMPDGGAHLDGGGLVLLDAGSTTSGPGMGIAGAIESLARGASVCPGEVTVTPKTSAAVCRDSSASQERSGVTIVFNGCTIGQSQIDGMVDVATVRSVAGGACDGSTSVLSKTTLTVTNLSIRLPGGAGIVIPSEIATSTASAPPQQMPQAVMATSAGELQVFDASGRMIADLTTQGSWTFSQPNAQSYAVDGTQTVHEAGNATATVTETGVTRSGGCCRPTAGTVVVDRSGGASPGKVTWQFSPSCGEVTRNGAKVTLSACLQ